MKEVSDLARCVSRSQGTDHEGIGLLDSHIVLVGVGDDRVGSVTISDTHEALEVVADAQASGSLAMMSSRPTKTPPQMNRSWVVSNGMSGCIGRL
jgi:hypothetical protein